ncbi:restriction endonuclease subunit S [Escherichia coli]|uniref:restriction endonuclease subunit S n=1 Tax=Escherichia coli TaxID=562 RepID=UPI001115E7A9|nr:restriction endonuclease subunit S [Escherichia coli]
MARDSLYPVSVKAGKPILGMLPTGWQKLSLEKCLNIEARKAYIQDNQEYDLVTVKRSRGGVIRREHLKGKDISVKSQFYIKEGDFLISKRQIVHGACGLVPKEFSGSIVSNEYCVLTGKSGFYLPYMEFLSESLYFQQTCFHSSIGVHIEKMIFKLDSWFKWPFNIPPLSEQKRIVKILSTWDKAISVTEKLLANSQQQKKALMQQLVTGKKRLLDENGVRFSGEWEQFPLKVMAEVIVSPVDKKTEANEIPVELCNYTDVYYNNYITNNINFMKATATKNEIEKYTLKKGDVIITKDSETPGDIAIPALVSEDLNGVVCGYHLAIIRPKNKIVVGSFLNYLFSMQKTRYYFFTLATGATRFGLSVGGINYAHFSIPKIEEQQKIAAVLSAADAEISVLEKKLACLKDEKKALMQQLLTGKRRVKTEVEETVSA